MLSKQGFIHFSLQLVPAVTELMVAELLYLEKQGNALPIEMLINSSGTTRQDGEIVSHAFSHDETICKMWLILVCLAALFWQRRHCIDFHHGVCQEPCEYGISGHAGDGHTLHYCFNMMLSHPGLIKSFMEWFSGIVYRFPLSTWGSQLDGHVCFFPSERRAGGSPCPTP